MVIFLRNPSAPICSTSSRGGGQPSSDSNHEKNSVSAPSSFAPLQVCPIRGGAVLRSPPCPKMPNLLVCLVGRVKNKHRPPPSTHRVGESENIPRETSSGAGSPPSHPLAPSDSDLSECPPTHELPPVYRGGGNT